MRVVIDTNLLLSGLLWRGTPHLLLNQIRTAALDRVMSPALLEEFAEVIHRPKFAAILQQTTRTPERILSELRALAEVVAVPPLPQPVSRDPDDDAVLACALGRPCGLGCFRRCRFAGAQELSQYPHHDRSRGAATHQ